MQSPTRQFWFTGLAVSGLVVANLAFNVAVMTLTPKRFENSDIFNQFLIGWLFGQIAFVGVWLGLGDWRWYVRVLVAVALTLGVAKSIDVAMWLTNNQEENGSWGELGFMMIAMGLSISLPFFLLRRTRSWRLTWRRDALPPPVAQFQIGDALLWTVLISGVLGALRFLHSIDSSFEDSLEELFVLSLWLLAGMLTGLIGAFSSWSLAARLALLLLAGMLFSILATATSHFLLYPLPSRTWQVPVSELTKNATFIFTTIGCSLANSLALRGMGCRLIRPGNVLARATVVTAG